MTATGQMTRYARRRLTRQLYRAVPWLGSVVALATLGQAIARKGVLGGSLHTALDFVPFVGGAKIFLEVARGQDFIRDKPVRQKSL
jgi:hypothetical protein